MEKYYSQKIVFYLLFTSIFFNFLFSNDKNECIEEGYILVQIKYNISSGEIIRYGNNSFLFTDNLGYFIKENDFVNFLKSDTMKFPRSTSIIDPSYYAGIYNLEELKEKTEHYEYNYTCGFLLLLLLDDTPIIKINEDFYALRKLKFIKKNVIVKNMYGPLPENKVDKLDFFVRLVSIETNYNEFIKDHFYCYRYQLNDFLYKK